MNILQPVNIYCILFILQYLRDCESRQTISSWSHLTAYVFPLSCLPLTPVTYLEKMSAVWAVTAWGEGCCHEGTRGNEWAETKTKQKASGHGVSLYYRTGSPVQLAAASHLLMFKSHLTHFHIETIFFFLITAHSVELQRNSSSSFCSGFS